MEQNNLPLIYIPSIEIHANFTDALKVISHQGMPSYRHHEMGDLYIRIAVNFPPSIEPSLIPLLEQALPARNKIASIPKKTHVDEVTLEEPNDRQRRAAANGDEMDEDEDERGGGGVQCAQRESEFHIQYKAAGC